MIQLLLEYNPAPPFNAGSPENAGDILVQQVNKFAEELIQASKAQTQAIALRVTAI